jgi:nitrite reductase/ring-hydroxylating ferredoxin subunit
MDNLNNLVDALITIVNDCNWQNIGSETKFQPMKCYKFEIKNYNMIKIDYNKKLLFVFRLYCVEENDQDIVLVRSKKNKFYAVDARCSHEGKSDL